MILISFSVTVPETCIIQQRVTGCRQREMAWQVGRQAGRLTGRQAGRQAGRQTDRQTGRQTDRQTDRQADRSLPNTIYQSGGSGPRQ